MTVTFYAQPYDMTATGFYFTDETSYRESIDSVVNAYGDRIEEFDIHFINGFVLDSKLARVIEPTQSNIIAMMEAMNRWTEEQKTKVILAVGEGGQNFDPETDDPDDIEIDLYPDTKLTDLAYQFVDEGLLGELSDRLVMYLDFERIARDLAHDYTETNLYGETYVYRLA